MASATSTSSSARYSGMDIVASQQIVTIFRGRGKGRAAVGAFGGAPAIAALAGAKKWGGPKIQ